MELVAFLGNDKETWGQVTALINKGEWDKVIIIQNKNVSGFPLPSNGELLKIDSDKSILDLKEYIQEKLKKMLATEFEVALSLASGNGKEHMAVISALLNIPVGIKLVVFTKNGLEFIS